MAADMVDDAWWMVDGEMSLSIDSAELVFENMRAPLAELPGGIEGQGFQQAAGGPELGRINVAARGVGLATGALEDALRYSQTRKTFGKPICEHQAITQAPYRRALRCGGGDGNAVRLGGGCLERHGRDARARRLQLVGRLRRRALLPRLARQLVERHPL